MVVLSASVYPVPSASMILKETAVKCFEIAGGHCTKATHSCSDKSNKKSENDCPNGACNPFAICNCFPAIIAFYKDPDKIYYDIKERKPILGNEGIYSAYQASCWHPPELI